MLIALVMIGLFGVACLILPCGAGLRSVPGKRTWSIILMGIAVPVPRRILSRIERALHRKLVAPAKPSPAEVRETVEDWQSTADRLRIAWRLMGLAWGARRWFFRAIRFRVKRFDLTVASPDPALTGFAFGMACAVQSMLPSTWPATVRVDFDRQSPQLSYDVSLTIIPLYILIVAGKLAIGLIQPRRS
jgi:hypothetical protein